MPTYLTIRTLSMHIRVIIKRRTTHLVHGEQVANQLAEVDTPKGRHVTNKTKEGQEKVVQTRVLLSNDFSAD